MKKLSLIGFSLSLIVFIFGLYLWFVVVPDAEVAEAEMEHIASQHMNDLSVNPYQLPEYRAAFEVHERQVDYGSILLFGSILPFLLSIVPAIKKNGLAIVGVLFSLTGFFIAAAFATHMFS